MKIVVEPGESRTLVHVEGLLDESSKADFDEHVHPLLEECDEVKAYRRILIDLSGVPRISSAGAGILVTLVARANTKGVHVVMFDATTFVSSIFKASKLTKFFDLADDYDAAVAMLEKG